METVKEAVVGRVRGMGGMEWGGGGAQRILSQITVLCDTIMVDTCHYTFAKTHRMHTERESS